MIGRSGSPNIGAVIVRYNKPPKTLRNDIDIKAISLSKGIVLNGGIFNLPPAVMTELALNWLRQDKTEVWVGILTYDNTVPITFLALTSDELCILVAESMIKHHSTTIAHRNLTKEVDESYDDWLTRYFENCDRDGLQITSTQMKELFIP